MNTKQKGNTAEKQAKEILESWGYNCIQSKRTSRMIINKARQRLFISQENDFFGLFDIIAKNKSITRYIQVKSNECNVSTAKPNLETFFNEVCTCMDSVEIWLKLPRKGFRIYKYILNNKWVYTDINFRGEKLIKE